MRRQRQSPFRMIRRAQIIETPRGSRQSAIRERRPLAPPAIPKLPHITISAFLRACELLRKQSGRAEQSRLYFEHPRLLLARPEPLTHFAQSLHWPDIVFVTQCPEQPLPKRLFGPALPRPRFQLRRLALQSNQSGLLQKLLPPLRAQFAQRRATVPE